MSEDARAHVTRLITAAWTTQAIHAAVKLGIVEALADRARPAPELADALGLHRRSTFRLLRALAGLGLAAHRDAETFELTDAGRLLCADAPGSLRVNALHWGGRTWEALTQLDQTVKTGAAFKDSGREGFFAMKDNPELAHVFNMAMVSLTREVAPAIVAACDFSEAREAFDLGGGYGALLAAVLTANPHLTGATVDIGYMAGEARTFLDAEGVGDRARFIAADFFEAVPGGAAVYLLKFILHDWEDAESIAILRNTAEAAGARGRILVIERLAPARAAPGPEHEAVLRGDIQMMVSTGGVERTEAEYDALFAAAGLARTRTIPTGSPFSVLEAVKLG